MLIKKWMSSPVTTIDVDTSLMDVSHMFENRVLSMLPVLDGNKIAGIVTDGDIKKATPSNATSLSVHEITGLLAKLKIKEVMTFPVHTITEDRTVEEAARVMLEEGISGMPVQDAKGRLSGIITKSDIFRCLVSFTGAARKGQIFAFRVTDRPGAIKNLTDIIRKGGGRLLSILTAYDDIEEGFRKVFIHVFDLPWENFDRVCEELHSAGDLFFLADQTRDIRRLF